MQKPPKGLLFWGVPPSAKSEANPSSSTCWELKVAHWGGDAVPIWFNYCTRMPGCVDISFNGVFWNKYIYIWASYENMCLFYVYTVPIYFYTPTLKLQNNFQLQQIDAHSKAVGKLQELLKGWVLRGWLKVKQHRVKKNCITVVQTHQSHWDWRKKSCICPFNQSCSTQDGDRTSKNNGFKVKPWRNTNWGDNQCQL